jgi:hypothetical protein
MTDTDWSYLSQNAAQVELVKTMNNLHKKAGFLSRIIDAIDWNYT